MAPLPPAWVTTVEPPVSCVKSIDAVEPVIVPVFVMPPGMAFSTLMPTPEAPPVPDAVIVPEFVIAPVKTPLAPKC